MDESEAAHGCPGVGFIMVAYCRETTFWLIIGAGLEEEAQSLTVLSEWCTVAMIIVVYLGDRRRPSRC